MFEDYLEDANYFASKAQEKHDEREIKRYYRVSIFCAISAVEAFVNFIGNTLSEGGVFQPYEIAFLLDKSFKVSKGTFKIDENVEFHRLEEKIKFLIYKFIPSFDFSKEGCWSSFIEFKKFRDSITHPRHENDEIKIDIYEKRTKEGISAVIDVMNIVCKAVFRRPLRQKIVDFKI